MQASTVGTQAAPERSRERPAWRAWGSRALVALAIALSAFLLYRTLSGYDTGELVQSVRSVPLTSLLVATGWAAASYCCLTLNDWLALRYAGRPLPYPYAARTSFVALAFGHNIGFAALSSGAIRYRFYSRKGVGAAELAKIIVFCGITIFLGMFVLGVLAVALRPDFAATMTGLPAATIFWIGVGLFAVPLGYLAMAWRRYRATLLGRTIEPPRLPLALAQVAVGTANFTFVAACLHAVLSPVAEVGYFEVLAAFVIANTATIITHAPGGLGVIESVVILLLRKPELIGALLVFRFVYYLLPLGLGAIVFALSEARWRKG